MVLWMSGAHRRRLIIHPVTDGYSVYLEQGRSGKGKRQHLGILRVMEDGLVEDGPVCARVERLLLRGCRIVAVLSVREGGALVRSLSMPQATERHLGSVLRNQLSRLTPFPEDRAAFDYEIEGRRIADGQIAVRLAVAPLDRIEVLRNQLADLGLEPDVIAPAGDRESVPEPFDFLGPEHRPARRLAFLSEARRRVAAAFLGALAIFTVLNMGGKMLVWLALVWTLPEARDDARVASHLQLQVEALSGSARILSERKAEAPSMVALMESLSRTIPDGTWLTGLRIGTDAADIQGISADATALLTALEAAPAMRKPEFAGSVTTAGGGGERFHIRVRIEPPKAGSGNGDTGRIGP